MLGDKFNFGGLLKNAKKIQDMMEQAQNDLAQVEVTGESGAGLVKIIMTARHEAKKIMLDDSLLQESKEVLEELIAAAINDASHKIEEVTKSKMMDASSVMKDLTDEGEDK